MEIFFNIKDCNKQSKIVYYVLYVVLNSCLYLLVNIPIIMMLYNLVALYALSNLYKAKLKNRIIAAIYIYMFLMVVESIVALGSGYFHFPLIEKNNYSSIMGVVLVKVISYISVLLISNYKNIKNGIDIPKLVTGALILIPTGSLFIMITLFQTEVISLFQVWISCIILFMINLIAFYFFDFLNKFFEVKINGAIADQQTKYYMKQLNITEKSIENNSALKHDWHKHISSIYTLAHEDTPHKLIAYLDSINEALGNKELISNTGNTIIDSILNYELSNAKTHNIDLKLDLDNIPSQLEISSFDLTTIFSNLLSNAISGCKSVSDNRELSITIRYSKGVMVVLVNNTFNGNILFKKGKMVSTKSPGHGIGLTNVKRSLIKYNGEINIAHDHCQFKVEMVLYL